MIPAVEQLRLNWAEMLNTLRTQDDEFHPACDKCTSDACCYEPVFSDPVEVSDILGRLTPEQHDALRERVMEWYHKAKQFTGRERDGLAFDYLAAHIRCPFLVNGRCSIYETRPLACRTHYALEKPENCQPEGRRTQRYALFEHNLPYQQAAAQYLLATGKLDVDHFGLWLYNKLFGFEKRSAAAETYILEETTETKT